MNKLLKTMKAFKEIIKKPYLLNKIIDSSEVWNTYLKKKYLFSGFPVVAFEDLFETSADTVYPFTFTDGGSFITDLLLLKTAAMAFTDCSYFEIGTWRGESVANISSVAKECYTLNLSDSELKELQMGDTYIRQIGLLSSKLTNVIHLKGNSITFDFKGLNKTFDLIFIDGNHHYDIVLSDTKRVFESLVHDTSIVIWHDYAYHPDSVRSEVASAILDGTPEEFHPYIYHPEGTLSALFIRKKISGKPIEKYGLPNRVYRIRVEKTPPENTLENK
jgi:predicted O-methyltransferase YrrM